MKAQKIRNNAPVNKLPRKKRTPALDNLPITTSPGTSKQKHTKHSMLEKIKFILDMSRREFELPPTKNNHDSFN